MASGLQVFDALTAAIQSRSCERNSSDGACKFKISELDCVDLGQLTADDLESRGYDRPIAEEVSADLQQGSLSKLAQSLSVVFDIDHTHSVRSLVPLERLRESAGSLADEEETLEETLRELDRIRHPHRYAV